MPNLSARFRTTIGVALVGLAIGFGAHTATAQDTSQPADASITKAQMVYSYDEMFDFNIQEYLQQHAPHLVSYAEIISHYAGYSSISPKILISLMEQQTGLVTNRQALLAHSERPFGQLSDKTGFREQVADISDRLAKGFYRGHAFADTGINEKRTTDRDATKALNILYQAKKTKDLSGDRASLSIEGLGKTYRKLFDASPEKSGGQQPDSELQSTSQNDALGTAAPSTSLQVNTDSYFQLPFPVNDNWTYGGSHTNTGSGSYPQSSLDFNRGGYWGSDLSHIYVAAAAPGRVVVHSSCLLEVVHDDGWSTTYYHLSGIRVGHNTTIARNTKIANYASNYNQALCNGGQSSGPHVHFSLKRNGQYYHLSGMQFSGFEINTGRDSYDNNCYYFWLEKNDNKYCAWNWIINPGVDDSQEPQTWPMDNGQVRSNIWGSKGIQYYYKISVPEGASDLNIQSYYGSGDADMYVRRGALPTISNYDCRPYNGGNNETCSFETPAAGDWYVMLHGAEAFNGLSLKTEYTQSGGGYSQSNLSLSQGQWLKYWINVPEGMSQLTVTITGANGDADLYVKKTDYPTQSSYDCRPYKQGSTETCTFDNPEGRQWYIGIHAYQGISGLSLDAEWRP